MATAFGSMGLVLAYHAEVPVWVRSELAASGDVIPDIADRMRLLNRLAARNIEPGGTGGPFSAMVVVRDTGAVVSVGVNAVLGSNLSSAHAEVVALSLAQTRLNSWDLGASGQPALELDVNWRPCVQCYGATMWSGVKKLVIAGSGPELEELTGFDEGPMVDDWAEQFEARGIDVEQGVLRDEAISVFETYHEKVLSGAALVYNGRGAGALGVG